MYICIYMDLISVGFVQNGNYTYTMCRVVITTRMAGQTAHNL